MRVKTAAATAGLAIVGAAAAVQLATHGGWPTVQRQQRSSSEMAPARKVRVPDDTERARVVIQACWYPASGDQQVTVPWKLGSELQYDVVGPPLNCQTPWARSALLKRGDTIWVGWILNKGPVSKFKARITVNNRVAIDVTGSVDRAAYQCVLGAPPCGF